MLSLGGPKQRAVLALLLLEADAVVPLERLVDELWGEEPPASAAHTLETYVSRLRAIVEPHGPAIERRGRGYVLELRGATLDTERFERLVDEAAAAAGAGDRDRTRALASEALSSWRGRPLIDTSLAGSPPIEVARLDEVRRRALELRIDADLAAGLHDEVVGELRALVAENPYSERLVGQLMVALYRCGRQAEAVEVYERTRRRIDDELGLQPGDELRTLSTEIIRHEERLKPPPIGSAGRARRLTPATALTAAALVAFAAGLAILLVSAGGAGRIEGQARPTRVALVVPRLPRAGAEDTFVTPFVEGLESAARRYGLQTELLLGDDFHGRSRTQERLAARIRAGRFDLVIVASEPSGGEPLDRAIFALPDVRFVFVDAYRIRGWRVLSQPNVTLVRFADGQAGYLAGYLGGLVEHSRHPRRGIVSIVAGMHIPQVTHLVAGFVRGARRAAPGVRVLTAYSRDFVHRARCARLAARQIDAGSDVVFAAAGTCGLGALEIAGLRGVWGVGADEDRSYLGAHILASTVKRFDRAVFLTVRWFLEGTLPRGGDLVLGLDEDAVGLAGLSGSVPQSIRRRVTEVARQLHATTPRSTQVGA